MSNLKKEEKGRNRKIPFLKIILKIRQSFCSGLIVVLFLWLFLETDSLASPKFLIFHLDAVPSEDFFQFMKEGYLPNLQAVFEDGGHIIRYGLSLYPGGTEIIVPHLKEGTDSSTGGVGWGYYDREKGRVVSNARTFIDLLFTLPRRARASFIYGLPWLGRIRPL